MTVSKANLVPSDTSLWDSRYHHHISVTRLIYQPYDGMTFRKGKKIRAHITSKDTRLEDNLYPERSQAIKY